MLQWLGSQVDTRGRVPTKAKLVGDLFPPKPNALFKIIQAKLLKNTQHNFQLFKARIELHLGTRNFGRGALLWPKHDPQNETFLEPTISSQDVLRLTEPIEK